MNDAIQLTIDNRDPKNRNLALWQGKSCHNHIGIPDKIHTQVIVG